MTGVVPTGFWVKINKCIQINFSVRKYREVYFFMDILNKMWYAVFRIK